ncbi:hypothetical protein SAMN05428988_4347 [Chitinophaga sp. YR573]|uniref:hypothetical protein n=1 Tax=Chitinophaga sp. YR573 TaxID=1881040 RepID=UPI0008C9B12A|nr:hypothetical protein [Chitinophaga sp. YR573]SEW35550.1 hypothetical protein SAMN05428988_4347 [Chitinophaga sp. YR573]
MKTTILFFMLLLNLSALNGQTICAIAKEPKTYYTALKSTSLISDDNCSFKVLDSLRDYVIRDNDTTALVILNKMAAKFVGTAAEALDNIAAAIFHQNLPFLLWFCDANKNSSIERTVILGLSIEVYVDKEKAKERINKEAATGKSTLTLSPSQIKILNRIISSIDG